METRLLLRQTVDLLIHSVELDPQRHVPAFLCTLSLRSTTIPKHIGAEHVVPQMVHSAAEIVDLLQSTGRVLVAARIPMVIHGVGDVGGGAVDLPQRAALLGGHGTLDGLQIQLQFDQILSQFVVRGL